MKSIFKMLALVLYSLIGLATLGFADDTIKIGVAGVISGDYAPYGLSSVRGAQMAVEDINTNGGILGKKLEILIGDDVCKPEVSVNMSTKLVSDGAQMIVGHICSGCTIASNKIYKDAGLLVVSPASTNDDLTLKGEHPNFFRTISYDGAQADLMTSFAKNHLKAQKVALIHDKGDYGKGQIELVKKYFEKFGGVKIVLYEGITTGAVDFTAIVQKIKRAKADVTIWGGYHSDASKIIRLIKKKKVKTIFFGGDATKGENFLNLAGKYAEGVYATGPNDTSSNSFYQKITARHQKKYGEDPGTYFHGAYASVQALTLAAEKAGSLDYNKMRAAMFENTIESPLGPIGFNKDGDVIGAGFSVYQVQNGKYVQVN